VKLDSIRAGGLNRKGTEPTPWQNHQNLYSPERTTSPTPEHHTKSRNVSNLPEPEPVGISPEPTPKAVRNFFLGLDPCKIRKHATTIENTAF
jgi:hypothetical protein